MFLWYDLEMIPRILTDTIAQDIAERESIIVLYGARQVGKTTLITTLLKESGMRHLALTADDKRISDVFSSRDLHRLEMLVAGYSLVFLDEAQRIPEVGLSLKLLHDAHPEITLVITGSSSLEMVSKTKESLAGRVRTRELYPLALSELAVGCNRFELDAKLEDLLIYGSYPAVLSKINYRSKQEYLYDLCSAYLYKDIVELLPLRHSNKIRDLLKLLAFQIGSQVSLSELGSSLGLSKETVASYIDLLEKSFVVFRVGGFSRNLRKEMTKMGKIYFYDCGIRNSIIGNYNRLEDRDDTGRLWENFLMVERRKQLEYSGSRRDFWFWRTSTGAELDLVEEGDGVLAGYEFKWKKKAKGPPAAWMQAYSHAQWQCINRDNYLSWLLPVM